MKVHILRSADPLKSGETYTAICGKEVANSHFVFTCDESFGHTMTFNALKCCKECLTTRIEDEKHLGKYVYGLLNAQELKEPEEAA